MGTHRQRPARAGAHRGWRADPETGAAQLIWQALIDRVQLHLEAIYGLDPQDRASSFLIDDALAEDAGATGHSDEELLIAEGEDGELEVGLFLSAALRARLEPLAEEPQRLTSEALGPFCQLVEGVSHFLYLAHVAGAGRTVSLLEMEAQAEVDKFASCVLLRWTDTDSAEQLHRRLFGDVDYLASLAPAQRWRYEEANRLSRTFCGALLPHVRARRLERLLTELRYCYRLGAEAKLRHLSARRAMLRAG